MSKYDSCETETRFARHVIIRWRCVRLYKVELVSAVLSVRKAALSVRKRSNLDLAKYPLRRVVHRTCNSDRGNLEDGNRKKLFTGQLPRRLVLGCVESDAFIRNCKKNRFNFKKIDWMKSASISTVSLNPSSRRSQLSHTISSSNHTWTCFPEPDTKLGRSNRDFMWRPRSRLRPFSHSIYNRFSQMKVILGL